MVKKKRYKVVIPIIIISIILVSLGLFFFSENLISETFQGSSILSLSQVNLLGNSEFLTGTQWVYTLRAGGLSQDARGLISPNDVEGIYSGDETPEENLRIDTSFEQECVYRILNDNSLEQVYILSNPVEWTFIRFIDECTEEEAVSRGANINNGFFLGKYSGLFGKCFYIQQTKRTGGIANIESPEIHSIMDIEVTVNNELELISLDSRGSIQGGSGSGNVFAIWQGNLDTGIQCSSPNNIKPAYIGGQWILKNEQRYNQYLSSYDNMVNIINAGNQEEDLVLSIIDGVNSKANSFLSSSTSFGSIDEQTSLVNAEIVKTVNTLLQYPLLTLYIDADWIGIFTPVPDIKIESVDSNCFETGDEGIISVDVKNKGDERGNVNLFAVCDEGFSSSREEVFLNPDQTKTISLKLSSTTDKKELKGNCEVFAETVDKTVRKNVDVCVGARVSGNPNEIFCEGRLMKQYDKEGIKTEILKECKGECLKVDGEFTCSEGGKGFSSVCQSTNLGEIVIFPSFDEGSANIFSVFFEGVKDQCFDIIIFIAWALALIILFASPFLLVGISREFKIITDKSSKGTLALVWIFASLISIIIYMLVLNLIWLGVIIFIIVIIIRKSMSALKKRGKR